MMPRFISEYWKKEANFWKNVTLQIQQSISDFLRRHVNRQLFQAIIYIINFKQFYSQVTSYSNNII